jgi:hypothetical protein
MGRQDLLTHLLFVDDVLLFGNGLVIDANKYREAMPIYMKAI